MKNFKDNLIGLEKVISTEELHYMSCVEFNDELHLSELERNCAMMLDDEVQVILTVHCRLYNNLGMYSNLVIWFSVI